MKVRVLDDPLIRHTLTKIRDKNTKADRLREYVENITLMCMPYVLKDFPVRRVRVETPLEEGEFEAIEEERIVFVCLLRAGLAMLRGALKSVPMAHSGFLAIRRDEETLRPFLYYKRLPSLRGKWVLVLDPMLATGGTLSLALEELKREEPERLISLHIVASPEGIERVLRDHGELELYTVSIDRGLNERGYIVPGVGDMGDRLFTEGL